MILTVIKKYKYTIGIFLIFISTIFIWQYFKKENIYILYDDIVSSCQNIDKYEKNKYPLCNNGNKYVFEKKSNQPIFINDLKKIKLTSKEAFFNFKFSDIKINLVIKKKNTYEILPVKIFQILS